jgi:hypothetical protein
MDIFKLRGNKHWSDTNQMKLNHSLYCLAFSKVSIHERNVGKKALIVTFEVS